MKKSPGAKKLLLKASLRLFLLFLLWSLSACGGAGGGGENGGANSVTLAWDRPGTNIDGAPLTDLVGYVIYYGGEPDFYLYPEKLLGRQEVKENSVTITNLWPGVYYFVVTAVDTYGNESEPATLASNPNKNVLCVNIPTQGNPYECSP